MIDCTTAAHHELPLPGQQRGQLITRWRAADGAQHCRPHELYEKVVIGKGTRLALQPIDAGLIRQCTEIQIKSNDPIWGWQCHGAWACECKPL
mmetsp:Transcript_27112/g.79638  ORF Transcript_27112/g.79638 Transcript_27112/m.79638 type:complete len:93 (-) Transcript_27112:103-381(-)